jgi:autotransporter-associated beta strand protein
MNPKLLIGGAFTVGRNITVGANNNALGNAGTTFTIGGSTANTSTFSGVTTLNQNLSVTQVTDGTLNLTGNITSGSSGTQTVTFNNVGSVSQSTGVIGGGTGTVAVTQAGAGTTTLSGANTYTGLTTVNGGTLEAAATNSLGSTSGVTITGGTLLLSGGGSTRIHDSATVTLNAGTLATAALKTGGLEETVGKLTLTLDSVIDLGTLNSSNALRFASSTTDGGNNPLWNGASTLHIWNWSGSTSGGGADQIFVGTSNSGLTSSQLDQIRFYSDAGLSFLGTASFAASGFGELVPIPETGTLFAAFGLLGLVVLCGRRRNWRDVAAGNSARRGGSTGCEGDAMIEWGSCAAVDVRTT